MSDGVLQKPELWTEEKVEEERGKEEQLYFAAISHYRKVYVDMAETRIRLHLTNSRPQTPADMNMIETIMWKRSQMREEPSSSDIFQEEDPKDLSTDLEQDIEEKTEELSPKPPTIDVEINRASPETTPPQSPPCSVVLVESVTTEELQEPEPLNDREETVITINEPVNEPSPVPETCLLHVEPCPSIRRNSAPDERLKLEIKDSPRRHSSEKTLQEQKRETRIKNETEKKKIITKPSPRAAFVHKTKEPVRKYGEWGFHNERICQVCALQKIRQRDREPTVWPLPDMTF